MASTAGQLTNFDNINDLMRSSDMMDASQWTTLCNYMENNGTIHLLTDDGNDVTAIWKRWPRDRVENDQSLSFHDLIDWYGIDEKTLRINISKGTWFGKYSASAPWDEDENSENVDTHKREDEIEKILKSGECPLMCIFSVVKPLHRRKRTPKSKPNQTTKEQGKVSELNMESKALATGRAGHEETAPLSKPKVGGETRQGQGMARPQQSEVASRKGKEPYRQEYPALAASNRQENVTRAESSRSAKPETSAKINKKVGWDATPPSVEVTRYMQSHIDKFGAEEYQWREQRSRNRVEALKSESENYSDFIRAAAADDIVREIFLIDYKELDPTRKVSPNTAKEPERNVWTNPPSISKGPATATQQAPQAPSIFDDFMKSMEPAPPQPMPLRQPLPIRKATTQMSEGIRRLGLVTSNASPTSPRVPYTIPAGMIGPREHERTFITKEYAMRGLGVTDNRVIEVKDKPACDREEIEAMVQRQVQHIQDGTRWKRPCFVFVDKGKCERCPIGTCRGDKDFETFLFWMGYAKCHSGKLDLKIDSIPAEHAHACSYYIQVQHCKKNDCLYGHHEFYMVRDCIIAIQHYLRQDREERKPHAQQHAVIYKKELTALGFLPREKVWMLKTG